jgi:hypothetical protein
MRSSCGLFSSLIFCGIPVPGRGLFPEGCPLSVLLCFDIDLILVFNNDHFPMNDLHSKGCTANEGGQQVFGFCCADR